MTVPVKQSAKPAREDEDRKAEAEAKALGDLKGYQIRTWGRRGCGVRGRRLGYEASKKRGDKIKRQDRLRGMGKGTEEKLHDR